jgi:small membrane protein
MIAQFVLTALLTCLLLYAVKEARKSPAVGIMNIIAAIGGLFVVWVPNHASAVAEWAGIGRGADLILYVWAALSLIIMLNLHLKLRSQLQLITGLARALALLNVTYTREAAMKTSKPDPSSPQNLKPEGVRSAMKRERPFEGSRRSATRSYAKKAN